MNTACAKAIAAAQGNKVQMDAEVREISNAQCSMLNAPEKSYGYSKRFLLPKPVKCSKLSATYSLLLWAIPPYCLLHTEH